MSDKTYSRSDAGIYLIRYAPTDQLYVGQAVHIERRWSEHRRALKAGKHANKNLQELWRQSSPTDFQFSVVATAPEGLSALQLQRWLLAEERRTYLDLKAKGVALNHVEPEIVPTKAAVDEYKIAFEKLKREYELEVERSNKSLSAKRRAIKEKLAELRARIAPTERHLYEMRSDYYARADLLRKSTGWRRLFYGQPVGYNPDFERECVRNLKAEIGAATSRVEQATKEIRQLEKDYREMRILFRKVPDERTWYEYWLLFAQKHMPEKISDPAAVLAALRSGIWKYL